MERQISKSGISGQRLDASREVELCRQDLSESLRAAGDSGSSVVSHIGQQAKPIVVSVAVMVCVSAVVCVAVVALKSGRASTAAMPMQQRSFGGNLARTLAFWLARAAVRRLVAQMVTR